MSKVARIVTGILTAFVALTAIGGGVALLMGAEGDRFPLTWLEGTLFSSYTLPGFILAVAVGGSALIAFVVVLGGRQSSALPLIASGTLLAGFVSIEVLILKQVPRGPTVTEEMYFIVGAIIFGFGAYHWRSEHQVAVPFQQRHSRQREVK